MEFLNGSNFPTSSDFDVGEQEEEVDDEVLVNRALAAFRLAEARGEKTVEMPEREWEAWQRREAMEREIERRVAERVESRIRSSPRLVPRAVQREPMGPGFMIPGEFAPLGGRGSSSPSPGLTPAGVRQQPTPPVTPHMGHLDSSRPHPHADSTPPQSLAPSPNLSDWSRGPRTRPSQASSSFGTVAPYNNISSTASLGALSEPELLDLNSDDEGSTGSLGGSSGAYRRRRAG